MTSPVQNHRQWLLTLYQELLHQINGQKRVANWLHQHTIKEPYYLIAVGKAAAAMAAGFREVVGEQCKKALVITKDNHLQPWLSPAENWELVESSHPVPDQRSLDAGQRLVAFVTCLPKNAQVYVLISGGASSLVEVLRPGVQLSDLQRANEYLLSNAFSIDQINAVRGCLSVIKAGGLLALFHEQNIQCLLLSDVPDDRLDVIGSGMLVKPAHPDCWRSLSLPNWLMDLCELGQQCQSGLTMTTNLNIDYALIGTLLLAKQCIAALAQQQGIDSFVQQDFLCGDTAQAAQKVAAYLQVADPGLYIWGGETNLQLPEVSGVGGRNQHFALCAAQALAGTCNILLLAVGTDGTDGPTPYAGGLVDGLTAARGQQLGFNINEAIATANSTEYLRATKDLIETGATGTNVMDLILGYKW